jgi:ribosome-associated heat shock protein Hsp15
MDSSTGVRIDKYLWAIRVFKTRALSAEACAKGRVLIDNVAVKPSRLVKVNDIILVRKPPVVHSYQVLGLLDKRQSAQIAKEHAKELTPEEEFQKLELAKLNVFGTRDRGAGRPTKKERRMIEGMRTDD